MYAYAESRQWLKHNNTMWRRDCRPFKVTIHDPLSLPDLRGNSVEVEAGYLTTFLIEPTQYVTKDPDVAALPAERRGCRMREETEGLKLFGVYAQTSCIFECMLGVATRKCGCVPWDYPHLRTDGLERVCDAWGR